jgi:hypothetical protein
MAIMQQTINVGNYGMGSTIKLNAGESIQVQLLNTDGSIKQIIYTDSVPAGKTFSGQVSYNGTLS